MDGHLAHGPYTIWPYVNDALWILILPAVAVMCWESNMYGKRILSLALLFLVATNVEIITGMFPVLRFPWFKWHPQALVVALLASTIIPFVGLFTGRQAVRSCAYEYEGRTKRVILVGVAVITCTTCFTFGFLAEKQQKQLALQKERRARISVLLDAYKMVEATSWSRAHSELGSTLLNATRYYEQRYGTDGGSGRFAKLFSEARAIADTIERQTPPVNLAPTNNHDQIQIDPITGLPLDAKGQKTSEQSNH
jgi:hypothetical protein